MTGLLFFGPKSPQNGYLGVMREVHGSTAFIQRHRDLNLDYNWFRCKDASVSEDWKDAIGGLLFFVGRLHDFWEVICYF